MRVHRFRAGPLEVIELSGAKANRSFGKRKESHVLILASGEKVRHMTIRPWMAAIAVSLFGLFTIGYLKLAFWQGVLALFIWPFYLGSTFSTITG